MTTVARTRHNSRGEYTYPTGEIAIVGIGCRYPGGANGPEALWQALMAGTDLVSEVDAQRWSQAKHVHPNREVEGKTYARWGGFVDGALDFDPEYFGLTPREVQSMDPQQRLVLQTFVEAMRDAGVLLGELRGTDTAVYIGGFTLDHLIARLSQASLAQVDAYVATGSMMTLLANRISYLFGLEGPSMVVDTACSSSLVATHLAVRSILAGESSLAVAGGVNVMLEPGVTIAESKASMLSPTGRCRSFSADADGYVRAEGCGVVVLKRLDAALADGDRVYAVIRGTAVNQDGRSEGQTVPRGAAQQRLLETACRKAGIAPRELDYVEAHGTGTPVGDPIEANALGEVLRVDRAPERPCLIASVKTCFGHSEAAAGVAGLIKTALAIHHGQLPPHLHVGAPNPSIDFEALGLELVREARPWPEPSGERLAAVNSFGFGGTNAQVILARAPQPTATAAASEEARAPLGDRHVYAVSAHSEAALDRFNHTLAPADADAPFAQICARQLRATDVLEHSQFVIAGDHAEAMAKLGAGDWRRVERAREGGPLVFVLSGMGPQWWGMGQQLLEHSAVFREAVEACDAAFASLSDRFRIIDELRRDEAGSRMGQTAIAQPANFVVQVGLVRMLAAWGVEPDILVGHSVGETAAAYLAGALSLDHAAQVVLHRSRLQATMAGAGSMLALGLSPAQARARLVGLESRVAIAAVNSHSAVTLAGDTPSLAALAEELGRERVFAKALRVEVPYHSPLLDPLHDEFIASVADIEARAPRVRLFSTVTGAEVSGPSLDAAYWWHNLRAPVYFADAMTKILAEGATHVVEVGPHPVLSQSVEQLADAAGAKIVSTPSLRRKTDEAARMLDVAATLHFTGKPVDWSQLYPALDKRWCRGAYPWVNRPFPARGADHLRNRDYAAAHPLLGTRLDHPTPTWEIELSCARLPYLRDHVIDGAIVVPGAAYVEIARAAGRELFGSDQLAVADLRLDKAVFLGEAELARLILTIDGETGGFAIRSRVGEGEVWTTHVRGALALDPLAADARRAARAPSPSSSLSVARADCYARFAEIGFGYGPSFQLLREVQIDGARIRARIDAGAPSDPRYLTHPRVLDALFHSVLVTAEHSFMPTRIARIAARPSLPARLDCEVEVHDDGCSSGRFRADIRAYCPDSARLLVSIEGFEAAALSGRAGVPIPRQRWLHRLDWAEAEPERGAQSRQRLVVFAGGGPLGDALVARLEAEGHALTRVAVEGPRVGERIRAALEGATKLDAVVFAAGLDRPPTVELEPRVEPGLDALRQLSQALACWQPRAKLWVVSANVQPVPDHPQRAGMAELLGWSRVLAHQELSEQWGGMIDLDAAGPTAAAGLELAAAVIGAGQRQREEWAIRAGRVYRGRWAPCPVARAQLPLRLGADETHWITGGLGGLGLAFAGLLADRGARHLVLFSRRSLPPQSAWAELPASDPHYATVTKLRALVERGVELRVSQADICDAAALGAELDAEATLGWPALRGVIHSAGVLRDGPATELSAADVEAVVAPKIAGAWALHRATRGQPLGFFVLFSSVASVLATAGQANYAAANAGLDQLAHLRRRLGLPALSINWGPWAELGMASARKLEGYFERMGIYSLPPAEALLAFEQALATGDAQIMVAAVRWSSIAAMYPSATPAVLDGLIAREGDAGQTASIGPADLDGLDAHAQRERIAAGLIEIVADVMQIDPDAVTGEDRLNELGVDSLLATELGLAIKRKLGTSLPLVELLKGNSVVELAELVRSQWRAAEASERPPLARELALDLVDRDHAEYARTCDLVQTCYKEIYDADVEVTAAEFIVLRKHGEVAAAMALSSAASGPLFSERYLVRDADELIAERERAPVARAQIAEVGTFAAESTALASVLFELTPQLAHALGHDYVLMTASRYIEPLLTRAGADFRPLSLASVAALEPEQRQRWGSFYASAPRTGYLCLDAHGERPRYDLGPSLSPALRAKLDGGRL